MRVVRVIFALGVAAVVLALLLSACSSPQKSVEKVGKASPEAGVPADMKGPKTAAPVPGGGPTPAEESEKTAPEAKGGAEGEAAPGAKGVKTPGGA